MVFFTCSRTSFAMDERISTLPPLAYACTKLLCAAGVPKTLEGAGTLLPVLQACLQAAVATWSRSSADTWSTHIDQHARALSDLSESDPTSAAHLYKALRPNAGMAFELQRWRPGATPDETQLDAILGRALICAGQSDNSLPAGLVSGLTTIKLSRRRKGVRAKDWELLRDADVSNADCVRDLIAVLGPKSPCAPLLTAVKAVLETGIIPADTLFKPTAPETASERPTEVEPAPGGSKPQGRADEDLEDETDKSRPPGTASIAARLATADFATVSEKLGIAHRDHLLPEDLARLTQQVATLLIADDRTVRGFATLAMCSAVTGTSDSYTLDLGFVPKSGSIWIDLEVQAWCWDFNAYRNTHRAKPQHPEDQLIEPIRLPLPEALLEALKKAKAQAPEANRLGDLIGHIQGVPQVALTSYRIFLRSLGDSAHPPYQARFARSIQFVFLELTGSDMLTSICTAFFSTVAPAALYYYQPTYASIYAGVQKVYQFLGFGHHTCPAPASERLLPSSVPDGSTVQEGSSQLVDYCNTARAGCLSATTDAERASHATDWMKGLCTAFVIQTAHRASKLERLTFTSLYTDIHVGVINDKDDTTDQHRGTARAIPFSTITQGILCAAAECLHVMGIELNGCNGDGPVFRTFNAQEMTDVVAVQTKDIAVLTARFFKGARPNFGRSLWVTALDEIGCNRWLIRFLTGHTRDVTRVGDGHFDVSVKRTTALLAEQMEALSLNLFISQTFDHSNVRRPQPSACPCPPRGATWQSQKHVDPRNLLDPIEPSTLHGWVQARNIRQLLVSGQIKAEPEVLSVLHMLYIDLVPHPDIALNAATDTGAQEIHDVAFPFIQWTRPHFVHPTLFPLLPTTARLLRLSQDRELSQSNLLALLDLAITATATGPNFASPSTPASRWSQLCLWAQNFRRMELAPTLLAVSHPLVSAPTLNRASFIRLASGTCITNRQPVWKRRSVQKPFQKKSADLKELTSLLNHYGDKTKRLGETRQRAKDLYAAIEAMDVNWTYGGLWLRDWLLEELTRTRRQDPGCYEITSLRTYVSTLLVATDWIHAEDPSEWDAQEWNQLIELISAACHEPKNDTVQGVHERVRPALLAIARSLSRRGQHVPREVFTSLRDDNVTIEPGDSASSVLITKEDQEKAVALSADWLQEDPYTFKLLEVRAQVAAMLPLRSGDVSSLKRDCITPSGGLVIRRVGFNNHKTQSTIRVTHLDSIAQAQLIRTRSELLVYANAGDLLVRGNGDWQTVSRDLMATEIWTQALKTVTNDPRARPHSVRAATIEEITWPDWQKTAAGLLRAELSAQDASIWVDSHQSEWTRLAKAASSAGHADIRSALFNYLAGWAVVHAIYARSLLSQETPAPALLRQLQVNPDGLRKARSRHCSSASSADPTDHFCPWRWLQSQGASGSRISEKAIPAQSDPTCKVVSTASAEVTTITINDKVLFVSLISLGQSYERTLAETEIPASAARDLRGICLDPATVEQCTNRARHAARDRGVAGDLALCNSPLGQDIRSWLLDLAPSALEGFADALTRSKTDGSINGSAQWKEISASLPSGFSLKVRQGQSHIAEEDFDQSLQPGMRYRLVPDDRLGRHPVLSLVYGDESNRVLSTRVTAVTKVTVLCIRAIRDHQRSQRAN